MREEILERETAHFRSIVESANDAIISTDRDNTIIFWNQAAKTMFGYSDADIVGKSINRI
ncbi:MAG: PAS domain S-box protein [Chloroflexi bacterium]|nr:PAS domain S-box protein [Chloroflexota bacterium]